MISVMSIARRFQSQVPREGGTDGKTRLKS